MKLEQQVTSLELSKRLKSLGARQESAFSWTNFDSDENKWSVRFCNFKLPEHDWFSVSAYTVAELGEMLPNTYLGELVVTAPYKTLGGLWRVDLDDEGLLCCEKNEADARANMLIYLLENNLLDNPL